MITKPNLMSNLVQGYNLELPSPHQHSAFLSPWNKFIGWKTGFKIVKREKELCSRMCMCIRVGDRADCTWYLCVQWSLTWHLEALSCFLDAPSATSYLLMRPKLATQAAVLFTTWAYNKQSSWPKQLWLLNLEDANSYKLNRTGNCLNCSYLLWTFVEHL